MLLNYFNQHLLLTDCKKKEKDFPLRTKNIHCVVPSASRVADRPLDFTLHYKDIAKFSWGGCDGVDISPINTPNINVILSYFSSKSSFSV